MKKLTLFLLTLTTILTACANQSAVSDQGSSADKEEASDANQDTSKAEIILSNDDLIEGNFQFIQGITAFEQGYYQEALNHLLTATVKLPKKAGINYALADTYLQLQDYSNATYYAAQAYSTQDDDQWYGLKLAEIQRKSGNLSEAIQTLQKLRKNNPRETDILYKLANLYASNQEWEKSNGVYYKIIQLKGDDALSRRERIQNYANLNEQELLIKEIEALSELEPSNTRILHNLADQYERTGQIQKAIATLHELRERDPHDAKAIIHISDLYVQQQRYSDLKPFIDQISQNSALKRSTHEAILTYLTRTVSDNPQNEQLRGITFAALDALTELYPESGSILTSAASFYTASGRNEQALIALKQTNSIQPNNQQAWLQRMQILLQESQFEEVIAVGLQANEYVPENIFVHYFIGIAYAQTNQHREAVSWLNDATFLPARRDFKSLVFAAKADSYQTIDEWEKAKEDYEQAIRLDPQNATALNNYAYYMSLRSEDLDKAADLSQQSLEIEPDTPSFLDTYGWILYLQENYEEALEFLTLAVENGGNSADIFEHLGFAHKSVGNTEEAISYFQKAIAEQPDLAEKLQPEIDALK